MCKASRKKKQSESIDIDPKVYNYEIHSVGRIKKKIKDFQILKKRVEKQREQRIQKKPTMSVGGESFAARESDRRSNDS